MVECMHATSWAAGSLMTLLHCARDLLALIASSAHVLSGRKAVMLSTGCLLLRATALCLLSEFNAALSDVAQAAALPMFRGETHQLAGLILMRMKLFNRAAQVLGAGLEEDSRHPGLTAAYDVALQRLRNATAARTAAHTRSLVLQHAQGGKRERQAAVATALLEAGAYVDSKAIVRAEIEAAYRANGVPLPLSFEDIVNGVDGALWQLLQHYLPELRTVYMHFAEGSRATWATRSDLSALHSDDSTSAAMRPPPPSITVPPAAKKGNALAGGMEEEEEGGTIVHVLRKVLRDARAGHGEGGAEEAIGAAGVEFPSHHSLHRILCKTVTKDALTSPVEACRLLGHGFLQFAKAADFLSPNVSR